ncbi:MAG: hypothetical protein AAGA35_02205 [Patescibacteria group bacterium]
MNKYAIIVTLSIVGISIIGSWYATHLTDQYVAAVENEVEALEATLEQAMTLLGETAVDTAAAHQLHVKMHGHLNTINDHHPAVGLTGYTEEHTMSLQAALEKLEEFLLTHGDTLQALDEAAETQHVENQLAKNNSSGAQLFRKISSGIDDTKNVITGHIEDV